MFLSILKEGLYMTEEEAKIQNLTARITGLEHLTDMLGGLSPARSEVSLVSVITTDNLGNTQAITFDGDKLDTYLIFSALAETAKVRSVQLKDILNRVINPREDLF